MSEKARWWRKATHQRVTLVGTLMGEKRKRGGVVKGSLALVAFDGTQEAMGEKGVAVETQLGGVCIVCVRMGKSKAPLVVHERKGKPSLFCGGSDAALMGQAVVGEICVGGASLLLFSLVRATAVQRLGFEIQATSTHESHMSLLHALPLMYVPSALFRRVNERVQMGLLAVGIFTFTGGQRFVDQR
ncbi:unnamed protein product [Ectocarpus sp. 12 AP-2014]